MATRVLAWLTVLVLCSSGPAEAAGAEFGREIPPPAGGYALVPEMRPGDKLARPAPGQPVRVMMHKLAAAGTFDPDGGVVVTTVSSQRGFESALIGIPSAVPARGAKLAVYSFPGKMAVTLVEDINTLIGGPAGDERGSQTSIAAAFCRTSAGRVCFGTGQVRPVEGYVGGHLIEFNVPRKEFRDLGVVLSGWSVRRLVRQDDGQLLIVLESSDPNEDTRLYRLRFKSARGGGRDGQDESWRESDRSGPEERERIALERDRARAPIFEDTGVRDVTDLWPGGDNAWYLSGRRTALRHWRAGEQPTGVPVEIGQDVQLTAAEPAWWVAGFDRGLLPGQAVLLDSAAGPFSFTAAPAWLAPAIRAARPGCVGWIRNRHWTGPLYPDSPQNGGVLYLARPAPSGTGAHLTVWALAEQRLREYPILDAASGAPMQPPLALGVNCYNDALVVGTLGDDLAVAEIEDVFLDEAAAMDNRLVQDVARSLGQGTVRVRAWSLTGVSEHLDRPYMAIQVAGDGTVYAGAMPHHPTRGTAIFRYDPRRDVLENLGDIDELSGETQPADVPGMMHSVPTQVGPFMCFTGQDPFYGAAPRFPELPAGAAYPGSHVLAYDLRRGVMRDFGIPAVGKSMFWMGGDPNGNLLYLRADYSRGPMYRMNLATGQVDDLDFPCPSYTFHISADGKLYYTRSRERTEKEKARAAKLDDDHTRTDDLFCFDPAARRHSLVARDCPYLDWLKGQDGQANPLAQRGGHVMEFDPAGAQLRQVAKLEDWSRWGGETAACNGLVAQVTVDRPRGMRISRLLTARVSDGSVRNHGLLVDQKGRIASEINAVAVGPDGAIYCVGQFWPASGDPICSRERPPFRDLGDNCFIVVKGLHPATAE